jgi:hypothetical protein
VTRPRGRPRNADSPERCVQDGAIANAVHRLSTWGFPLRSEVLEAVGKAALKELRRGDHVGRALGPDRIEQIYKRWLNEQREVRSFEHYLKTGKIADVNPIFSERWRYTKESLATVRPRGSVLNLARKLLRGWKPPRRRADGYVHSEPGLTPRAESEYLAFRHALGRGKTG